MSILELKQHRARHRRLALEGLEGRAMLAGNVTASVSGGNLIIRGDNADNGVFVGQVAANQFVVVGFEFDGSPTTINGSTNVAGPFTVTGNIDIDVKKGDDAVGIGNDPEALIGLAFDCFSLEDLPEVEIDTSALLEGTLQVPRDLIVNLGDGDDLALAIANARNGILNGGNHFDLIGLGGGFEDRSLYTGSLLINTGNGGGVGCVVDTDVASLLSFIGGNGSDFFDSFGGLSAGSAQFLTAGGSDGVGAFDFEIDGSVVVNTASGLDFVALAFFDVGGTLSINVGAGGSSVDLFSFDVDGSVAIVGASGFDDVFLSSEEGESEIGGALSIVTGDTADFVGLVDLEVGLGVAVVTGNGDDNVEVIDLSALSLVIDTGNGNDGEPGDGEAPEFPILVSESSFESGLTIVTGNGEDLVLVEFTNAGTLVLNTGNQDDEVDIIESFIRGNAVVMLGNGHDTFFAEFLEVDGNATLDAGGGNDEVVIEFSEVGELLAIFMGTGNDDLSITSSSTKKALLRGGTGTDDLTTIDVDADEFDIEEFEL